MHKKGIIACSVFSVLILGALYSGVSFAAQTCTTDEQTGQVTCTNSATASVTVAAACSFSRTSGSGEYSGILANNASVEVTGSTFSTTCNDSGGYALYAIGYGNNTFGNTDLIFDNDPDNTNKITTSSSPESNTSYWQMKLAAGAENHPVLENGYGSYSAVPSTYTKVASYASADMGTAQTVTATYKAAASATQPAGTYTGAVKYTMVHPGTMPTPIKLIDDLEYMQDFATLTNAEKTSVLNSMEAETTYTLKDKRDEQEYTMAKLKDGKVWMTENLNLAGGTLLSSDTTDFDASYNLPTDRGWQSDGGLPASSASAFDDIDNYGYIYNTGNDTDVCSSPGCYSYYSWDVATVGSGRNITQGNTDASYSVCPKGWRLPKSRTTSATDWRTASDFYGLAHLYGLDSTISTSENDGDFNINAGPGTIPNFLLTGFYNRSGFNVGNSYGDYWSATYNSNPNSLILNFDATGVRSASAQYKWLGFAVRCVLRE